MQFQDFFRLIIVQRNNYYNLFCTLFHQNLLRINVWRGGNRQLDSNSHICTLFFVFSGDFSFQLLYQSIHIITVVCFTISFIKIYWELVSKSFKNNVGQLLWQIWLSRVTHHCHGHNRDCLLPLYTQSPSFIGPRLTRDVDIWLYMNMWTLKAA